MLASMTDIDETEHPDEELPEGVRWAKLAGRWVQVQLPNDTQLGVFAQQQRVTSRLAGSLNEEDIRKAMKAMAIIMNIFQNTLVREDDQEWAVDMMASRKLDAREVVDLLAVFNKEKPRAVAPTAKRARPARR